MTPKQRDILNEIAAWANGFPCIRLMHVFGSVARGEETPLSDLDVAFEYEADLDLDCYTLVNAEWEGLAAALKCKFGHQPKQTGLSPGADGYDHVAWRCIRDGREIGRIGKAVLTWTAPKRARTAPSTRRADR